MIVKHLSRITAMSHGCKNILDTILSLIPVMNFSNILYATINVEGNDLHFHHFAMHASWYARELDP